MPRPVRIIVAAYNQLPHLRRALRGYLRQTYRAFALTVADDGSRPDTAAWLAEFAAECARHDLPLTHVWHEDRGFRKNRILNEAVRRSEGEPLLVFSDGDCIPPARFVERHVRAHEPGSFHVGGAVRLTRDVSEALTEADVDAGRYEGLEGPADLKDLRRRHRKSRWGTWLRRPHRPKVLGLNMAIDRALFEAVNGFDERFEAWGVGEDSDLRDRVMRRRPRPRVKNLYLTNWVYHLWHPTAAGLGRAVHDAYYRSARPVRCEEGLERPRPPAGGGPGG